MTEQANTYKIKKTFTCMNENDKNIFLLIVKEFIRIQSTNDDIKFLNTTNTGFINQINNMGSTINNLHFNVDDTFILNISNLFNNNYKLFKMIYDLSRKRKLMQRIRKQIKDLIGNQNNLVKLKQIFNSFILLNLINYTISKKTIENMNEFRLLEQINSINHNAENILKLNLLRNDDKNIFLNAINYDTFSINILTEEEKQQIYEIFDLFY
jgi:hypothetical protein